MKNSEIFKLIPYLGGVIVIVVIFGLRQLSKGNDKGITPLPDAPKKEIVKEQTASKVEKFQNKVQVKNTSKTEDKTGEEKVKSTVKVFENLKLDNSPQEQKENENEKENDPIEEITESSVSKTNIDNTNKTSTNKKKSTKKDKITVQTVQVQKEETKEEISDEDYFGMSKNKRSSDQEEITTNNKAGKIHRNDYILAEFYGEVNIENGQTVTLQLLEPFTYEGKEIHVGSKLFGQAQFVGKRVQVILTEAKTKDGPIRIFHEIYDLKYMKGLYNRTGLDEGVEDIQDNALDEATNDILSNEALNLQSQFIATSTRELAKTISSQSHKTFKLPDGFDVYVKLVQK